jgi:heat shock 70kDa protein 1/2/6/8
MMKLYGAAGGASATPGGFPGGAAAPGGTGSGDESGPTIEEVD